MDELCIAWLVVDCMKEMTGNNICQRFNALQVVQIPRAEQKTKECSNIMAAEKVAGDVCQGLAVKLMPMKSHTLANNAKLRFKIYPN